MEDRLLDYYKAIEASSLQMLAAAGDSNLGTLLQLLQRQRDPRAHRLTQKTLQLLNLFFRVGLDGVAWVHMPKRDADVVHRSSCPAGCGGSPQKEFRIASVGNVSLTLRSCDRGERDATPDFTTRATPPLPWPHFESVRARRLRPMQRRGGARAWR